MVDVSIVFQIVREVDSGHAADTDFPLDAVAVGQCVSERARRFRHGSRMLRQMIGSFRSHSAISIQPPDCARG
jgi:hypothetical protein